jgi:hypothetical protein
VAFSFYKKLCSWQTAEQGSSHYFFLSSHLQMMWQVTPAMIERITEVNISTIILTSFDFSVEVSSMTCILYQKNTETFDVSEKYTVCLYG